MKDGQPLSESSAYSGTHSAMLLINEANQITEGEYCCHLSHGSEQLASSPVTDTIKTKSAFLTYTQPKVRFPRIHGL